MVFIPASRQLITPGDEAQDTVLPAAVATGPANSAIVEIWLAGYVSVHCRPAGVPEPDKERFRRTVPPGLPAAEERLRLEVCASKRSQG